MSSYRVIKFFKRIEAALRLLLKYIEYIRFSKEKRFMKVFVVANTQKFYDTLRLLPELSKRFLKCTPSEENYIVI